MYPQCSRFTHSLTHTLTHCHTHRYATTLVLGVVFCLALVLLVAHRMMSAWKRMKGIRRSDASGIARVFFNWIQMVSMLQSIKLQPPEEVTNAMETAEVMNVSIEWFPVQCTLRLNFFSRVVIYMTLPIVAVLIPLIYVYIISKCTPAIRKMNAKKRHAKRTGEKLSAFRKMIFNIVGILSGDDLVKKAQKKKDQLQHRHANDIDAIHEEMDLLIDDLVAAEAELAELKKTTEEETEEEETAAALATVGGSLAVVDEEEEEEMLEGGGEDQSRPLLADAGTSSLSLPLSFALETEEEETAAALATVGGSLAVVDEEEEEEMLEGGGEDQSRPLLADAGTSSLSLPLSFALAPRSRAEIAEIAAHEASSAVEITGRVFYEVISERPISLRSLPSRDSKKLEWVLRKGDVVTSERVVARGGEGAAEGGVADRIELTPRVCYVLLKGDWGEGWVFDSLPDGTPLLQELDAATMANPNAESLEVHERDEILHCFKGE